MEGILAGLVNLGLGGIMAAALVWFLYHLVTKTLPDITGACREEIRVQRRFRRREHRALTGRLGAPGRAGAREHEAVLARIDAGPRGHDRDTDEDRAPGGG